MSIIRNEHGEPLTGFHLAPEHDEPELTDAELLADALSSAEGN